MTPPSLVTPEAPAHAVHFYDHDQDLVPVVAEFVTEGLDLGERVIVVATGRHGSALDVALQELGTDPFGARDTGRYLTLNAATTLRSFMVDGTPYRTKFDKVAGGLLTSAGEDGSRVRVFGEMVGLLWDEGNVTAAIELELLWNDLSDRVDFQLLCAYPMRGLDHIPLGDVNGICAVHSSLQAPASYAAGPSSADLGTGHSRVFLPVPESIGAVRRFVSGVLTRWHEPDLIPDAVLMASELTTNAVTHTESPFRVSMDRSAGVVCLAVQDVGSGPATPQAASGSNADGPGMALVEAVSRRWGCDVLPGGKVVWAELTSTRGHRASTDRPA